jgi:ribonuclease HI
MTKDYFIIYTDGASRGNPGPTAIGVAGYLCNNEFIIQERKETFTVSKYLCAKQTNNWAEYNAILEALKQAKLRNITHLKIKTDSELIVKQINGQYKVKNDNIKHLFQEVKTLADSFDFCEFLHVKREQNKMADKLANLALDNQVRLNQ